MWNSYLWDNKYWRQNNCQNIRSGMRKKKKNIKETQSVPRMFAKKYIYYYYGFFWVLLILFILIKWTKKYFYL